MADVKILEYPRCPLENITPSIEKDLENLMSLGYEIKAFTDTGSRQTFVMVRDFVPYPVKSKMHGPCVKALQQ